MKEQRTNTIQLAARLSSAVLVLLCVWTSTASAQTSSQMMRAPQTWLQPMHAPPPAKMPLIVASRSGRTFDQPAVPKFDPESPADIEAQMDDWPRQAPQVPTLTYMDPALCCPPTPGKRGQGLCAALSSPAPLPWLAEPLSIIKTAGGFGSDEPIEGVLRNGIGLITSVRFGWDFAPRWGVESRFAWARTSLGSPAPGELASHENFWIWDALFCFYPFPETMWRPFLFAGAGMTDVRYIDQVGRDLHQSLFHIPVGFGIKRQIYGRHAFRIDVNDNLLFNDSRPRDLIHNVSVMAGFELRFGGGWSWVHGGGRKE
jgi:hypothetical protein